MGSTVSQILALFSRQYVQLLIVCFDLATPLVYFFLWMWLLQFAYKGDMSWWLFVIGGTSVLLITVLTVCVQSYRTAVVNPAVALKNE